MIVYESKINMIKQAVRNANYYQTKVSYFSISEHEVTSMVKN